MAGVLKKSTGLTGLTVLKTPHYSLEAIYDKLLRVLGNLPKDFAYRKHTEQIIKERKNIVMTTPIVEEVEKKIGCGQVEELLVQAENELILARNMAVWKPWEPLSEEVPPNQWAWPPQK